MLLAAFIFDVLAALGVVFVASKYIFGPSPTGYHRAMLEKHGADISPTSMLVYGALNKVFGFSLIGSAVAIIGLGWFGVYADLGWAKALLLIVGLIPSGGLTFVAIRMEATMGVRTPWRAAAGISSLLGLGFVFSLM